MTIHQPTPAVQESFGQAQQQAAAMAGPPPAWHQAGPASRRSPLWIGMAAAAVAASGVIGWFGVEWFIGSARPAPAHAGDRQAPSSPVRSTDDPAREPGAAGQARLSSMSIAPSATGPAIAVSGSHAVTRQAGLIRITSANASLAELVLALAQATHTQVRGAEGLSAIATPISLNWQGNDTAAAWDALLGRFASIAVSCSGAACDLWIVGAAAPRAAGSSAASAAAATIAEPAQPSRPAVQYRPAVPLPAQPEQQPGSEENTETN
ncbi:hypothetical protein BH11PSE8_BH11PSE8_29060 [soil metagenome]